MNNPSQLTVVLSVVSPTCLAGDTTVTVTNPNGGGSVSRGDAGYFVIGAMPHISSITLPTYRGLGELSSTPMQVWGSNFKQDGLSVQFSQKSGTNLTFLTNAQINAVNISTNAVPATSVTATINVFAGCPNGAINFQVTNEDQGVSELIYSTFTVSKAPTFGYINTDGNVNTKPTSFSLGQGATQQIYVFGTGFQSTNTVNLIVLRAALR